MGSPRRYRVYGAEGRAARSGSYFHDIGPTANLEQLAAAFGCFTAKATTGDEMTAALEEAKAATNGGDCAVINAILSED